MKTGLKTKFRKYKYQLIRKFYKSRQPFAYHSGYKYAHVICAVCRNEAEILEEWILFHLAVGVEHFILYDNLSTDNSRELLRPFEEKGLIEWKEFTVQDFKPHHQKLIYNRELRRMRGMAKWLWFLDTDEFLYPVKYDSIIPVMEKLEQQNKNGGVAVNWVFFGTNKVEELKPDEWHIERLTKRADLNWVRHVASKCGVRPEASPGFFIHHHSAFMYKNRELVFTNAQPHDPAKSCLDDLRLHHYWHRTDKFYREVKLERKAIFGGVSHGEKARKLHYDAHNKVEDRSMLRFIPKMRDIRSEVVRTEHDFS